MNINIEEILNQTGYFNDLKMDTVLFEGQFPILFTCLNKEGDVYLFICCESNAKEIVWIASQTDYKTLINMLQDKLTIRDAFMNVSDKKTVIKYKGLKESMEVNTYCNKDIDPYWLPTKGESMEVEEGEFDEEIKEFTARQNEHKSYFSFSEELYKRVYKQILSFNLMNEDDIIEDKTSYSEIKNVGLKTSYRYKEA